MQYSNISEYDTGDHEEDVMLALIRLWVQMSQSVHAKRGLL